MSSNRTINTALKKHIADDDIFKKEIKDLVVGVSNDVIEIKATWAGKHMAWVQLGQLIAMLAAVAGIVALIVK